MKRDGLQPWKPQHSREDHSTATEREHSTATETAQPQKPQHSNEDHNMTTKNTVHPQGPHYRNISAPATTTQLQRPQHTNGGRVQHSSGDSTAMETMAQQQRLQHSHRKCSAATSTLLQYYYSLCNYSASIRTAAQPQKKEYSIAMETAQPWRLQHHNRDCSTATENAVQPQGLQHRHYTPKNTAQSWRPAQKWMETTAQQIRQHSHGGYSTATETAAQPRRIQLMHSHKDHDTATLQPQKPQHDDRDHSTASEEDHSTVTKTAEQTQKKTQHSCNGRPQHSHGGNPQRSSGGRPQHSCAGRPQRSHEQRP